MTEQQLPKKKGRGKGKKPTLIGISMRVDREILDFFNQFRNRNTAMRDALQFYINHEKEIQNEEK